MCHSFIKEGSRGCVIREPVYTDTDPCVTGNVHLRANAFTVLRFIRFHSITNITQVPLDPRQIYFCIF